MRTITTYRKSGRLFILREIAFHEQAGRSQWHCLFKACSSFFFCDRVISPKPGIRCRHASIRTLEERIISLGACWAFSIQPVLPSARRPILKSPLRGVLSNSIGRVIFPVVSPSCDISWYGKRST